MGGLTRLEGSGTVPRVFALIVLVVVTVFAGVWLASGGPLAAVLVIEGLAVALAVRSLFVGVLLEPDAVLVRGWFRSFRYERGGLRAVAPVPYWRFLDRSDPLLVLLRFTPQAGWVREISTTVTGKDRGAAHAAAITRHLA